MARSFANNGRVYRAVITSTYTDGSGTFTNTFGPYDTPTPAKALVTRALNEAEASRGKWSSPGFAHTAEGHVESAEVIWMREE